MAGPTGKPRGAGVADQREDGRYDEDEEQDLRNSDGRSGRAAKSQEGGNECNDEKSNGPRERKRELIVFTVCIGESFVAGGVGAGFEIKTHG
jgi:hypothetical protein